jgi:hypothetical protein
MHPKPDQPDAARRRVAFCLCEGALFSKTNMNQSTPLTRRRRNMTRALQITVGGLMALTSFGQDAGRIDKIEAENRALKARLDSLESLAKKEGIVPSATESTSVKALSESTLSGFVTASYFYNLEGPSDRLSDGYLWNVRDNQFTINKIKLTLASPALAKDKFDAGYRVSLVFGEDAWAVNTGGTQQGFDELREAFVNLNIPIGSGLDVKVGQLISLLNYESGDGGAANNNFSQGYQWWYTGNGPAAGINLAYQFTDMVGANLRVQNGLFAGPRDSNDSKTIIASINLKPTETIWVNLLGFGGGETATAAGVGGTVIGGSILAGMQVTKELNIGFEGDYFSYDYPTTSEFDTWSFGTFISYDITDKLGLGLRLEYLDDAGGNIPAIGHFSAASKIGSSGPTDASGNLASAALTLNYKPMPNVKIQPEIRYDTTSYSKGFDGKESRVIIGAGVTYMF